jgi:hypothetical protein
MTAIDDLKFFVAEFFDGSVQRCLELDELLWQVRLAHKHEPKSRGPLPPPASPDDILKELDL